MSQSLTPYARQATRAANRAADVAEADRIALRWSVKPGDPIREARIADLLDLLDQAQRPVRSLIGRCAWQRINPTAETALRLASRRVQYERRQLKKMRRA